MNQSKLISLLRSLSPREIRRFGDYIRSPYFNKQDELVRVWTVLEPLAPDFPDSAIDRYAVFGAALSPVPTDPEIARLMSALLRHAEDFLGLEGISSDNGLRECYTLTVLGNHGLDKHFQSCLRRVEKLLEEGPHRTETWYFKQYQALTAEVNDQTRRQVRIHDHHFSDMVNALDSFYLCSRLRIACELVNRQSILSGPSPMPQVNALWEYLSHCEARTAPVVEIYAHLLHLLTEDTDAGHFEALRRLMQQYGHILTDQDRQYVFASAQNYCIRRIRLGDLAFLRALFDLYQEAIEAGYILEGGTMSPWKYKNIASVGLQVGEFDWVERFVRSYRDHLPESFRENAFAYNMADLHYHQGDYQKALRTLGQVEFTDVFYSLDTRKMQLKIYYEQRETEPLLSLIAAFRSFLRRNKLISEQNRSAYSNFVTLVHALWKASEAGIPEAVLPQIEATQPLVEEAWLRRMASIA